MPELEPPPSAPVPIAAAFSLGTTIFSVTFDQPLVPGMGTSAAWQCRITTPPTAFWRPIPPPTVAGNQISGPCVMQAPTFGPDAVTYTAVPQDIVGLVGGLPAVSFSDFPVTVTP